MPKDEEIPYSVVIKTGETIGTCCFNIFVSWHGRQLSALFSKRLSVILEPPFVLHDDLKAPSSEATRLDYIRTREYGLDQARNRLNILTVSSAYVPCNIRWEHGLVLHFLETDMLGCSKLCIARPASDTEPRRRLPTIWHNLHGYRDWATFCGSFRYPSLLS
jgi:hypothetical protein